MNTRNVLLAGCKKRAHGYIWNSMLEFNGLMKMDINTGEISFVGCFPSEDNNYQLHIQIFEYDQKLVFVPWNTNNIAIYDIHEAEFRQVSMKDYHYSEAGRFWVTVQADEKLYMASENAKEIVEFDMQKETIVNIHVFAEAEASHPTLKYTCPIKTKYDIWGIYEESNISWKFNFSTKKFERASLFDHEMLISAACGSDDSIWILGENTILYQFTVDGKLDREYDLSEIIGNSVEEDEQTRVFLMNSCTSDNIFIVRYDITEIIRIPIKNNVADISRCEIIHYEKADFSLMDQFFMSQNGKVIFFEGDIQKEIDIKKSEKFIEDIITAKNTKWTEDECLELNDFLQCILKCENSCLTYADECAAGLGKEIYEAMQQS